MCLQAVVDRAEKGKGGCGFLLGPCGWPLLGVVEEIRGMASGKDERWGHYRGDGAGRARV